MERRDFIKRAAIGTGALATPAAIAAGVINQQDTTEKSQDFAKENLEKLRHRLKEAEDKIDGLQSRQKKALRTAAVVAGLVIGLDISLLI